MMVGLDGVCMWVMISVDLLVVLVIEIVSQFILWSEGNFCDCLWGVYCCWVVVVDGELVGFMIFFSVFDEWYLFNVVVDLMCQCCGLVLWMLVDEFDQVCVVFMLVMYFEVCVGNDGVQSFYWCFGFVENGCCKGYYWVGIGCEDVVLMMLELFGYK